MKRVSKGVVASVPCPPPSLPGGEPPPQELFMMILAGKRDFAGAAAQLRLALKNASNTPNETKVIQEQLHSFEEQASAAEQASKPVPTTVESRQR